MFSVKSKQWSLSIQLYFITSSIDFLQFQPYFSSMCFAPIILFDFLNYLSNTQSVQGPNVDLLNLPGLIIKQLLNCRVP